LTQRPVLGDLYERILTGTGTGRCANCHGGGAGNFPFTTADEFWTAAVGVAAEAHPERQRVEPGWPSRSDLYLRILPDAEEPMPPRGARVPEADVAEIAAWICAGAKGPNEEPEH
jgi:hypothetical protein